MTNVVSLSGNPVPQAKEPQEDIIDGLKFLLAKAESGELQSFWGAGFLGNTHRVSIKSGHHNSAIEFLGALEWLKQDYIARCDPNDQD